MRKTIVIGIVCLFMLMAIPTTTGNDIEYPKENGPYTIFIGGYWFGSLVPLPLVISDEYIQLGPLCLLKYPNKISFKVYPGSVVMINGETPNYMEDDINKIDVYGLKGFYPAYYLQGLKIWTIAFRLFRARSFGICDEIDFVSYP